MSCLAHFSLLFRFFYRLFILFVYVDANAPSSTKLQIMAERQRILKIISLTYVYCLYKWIRCEKSPCTEREHGNCKNIGICHTEMHGAQNIVITYAMRWLSDNSHLYIFSLLQQFPTISETTTPKYYFPKKKYLCGRETNLLLIKYFFAVEKKKNRFFSKKLVIQIFIILGELLFPLLLFETGIFIHILYRIRQ